jgi:hypothetical protein
MSQCPVSFKSTCICRDRLVELALLFHRPDRVFTCDLAVSRGSGVAFRRSPLNGTAYFAFCLLVTPRSKFAIKAARASGCSFVVR